MPGSDICSAANYCLLDHLIGNAEQRGRHRKAERLRRDQIDDKLKLRRLLDWYIAGLGPAQYLVDVICRAPKTFGVTWSIGHEAPASDKIASAEDRWKPRAQGNSEQAYADWLKGYGLLLILDHGGGWMTLYAFNDALLKNTGDVVQAGETIATVGSSGGQGRPALYFELRKDGQPADPATWLHR